jgi:hypothetical protein
MGQHRTRKEKERAEQARLKHVPLTDQIEGNSSGYVYTDDTTGVKSHQPSTSLLKVDQRYILKDLIKTVSISSFLLLIVIGIYFYLRYN